MNHPAPTPAPFPAAQPAAGNTLQLEDIHYPAQPGFWPPAPGWWLLLFASLIILYFAQRKLRQVLRHRSELRETQRALEKLQQQLASENQQQAISDLNIFLRKMALTHFPQEDIASLTGKAWLQFLDRSGNTKAFTEGAGIILDEGPYRARLPDKIDTADLINAVQSWVNTIQKNQPEAISLYPAHHKSRSGGAS